MSSTGKIMFKASVVILLVLVSSITTIETESESSSALVKKEFDKTNTNGIDNHSNGLARNQRGLTWLLFFIPVMLLGLGMVVSTFGLRFVSTSNSGINIGKSFGQDIFLTNEKRTKLEKKVDEEGLYFLTSLFNQLTKAQKLYR